MKRVLWGASKLVQGFLNQLAFVFKELPLLRLLLLCNAQLSFFMFLLPGWLACLYASMSSGRASFSTSFSTIPMSRDGTATRWWKSSSLTCPFPSGAMRITIWWSSGWDSLVENKKTTHTQQAMTMYNRYRVLKKKKHQYSTHT